MIENQRLSSGFIVEVDHCLIFSQYEITSISEYIHLFRFVQRIIVKKQPVFWPSVSFASLYQSDHQF